MPIRALLWDVGGVLLRTEDPGPRQKWERRLNLSAGSLADAVFHSPAAQRATIGGAAEDDIWREAAGLLGVPRAELDHFKIDFFAGDRWDEELLRFIRGLHAELRMGVLSNAWPAARENFTAWIRPDIFDAILYSAEEHMRKPDERFFRLAADRLDVAPESILFIDDFLENVDSARKIGMMSVHFQDSVSVMGYLKVLLSQKK